eukprot:167337-Heterocapsa_arctica.AAC.1
MKGQIRRSRSIRSVLKIGLRNNNSHVSSQWDMRLLESMRTKSAQIRSKRIKRKFCIRQRRAAK